MTQEKQDRHSCLSNSWNHHSRPMENAAALSGPPTVCKKPLLFQFFFLLPLTTNDRHGRQAKTQSFAPHCSMKRILLPSASFTYISLLPQVWSTGPVSIRTPCSTNSAWRASTSSTIRLTAPPEIPSPENDETCSQTPSRVKPM